MKKKKIYIIILFLLFNFYECLSTSISSKAEQNLIQSKAFEITKALYVENNKYFEQISKGEIYKYLTEAMNLNIKYKRSIKKIDVGEIKFKNISEAHVRIEVIDSSDKYEKVYYEMMFQKSGDIWILKYFGIDK